MNNTEKQFYEFGKFRVDVSERRLLREGQFIPLPPKAFEMLLALIQNSGHLLTRQQLLKTIWADTFVDENNLRQYVSLLRKTLNENGENFIETVPRSGYRFLAEVHEVTKPNEIIKGFSVNFGLVSFVALALLLGIGFALNTYLKTDNQSETESYKMYREGRALWETRDGENLYKATLLLESAVKKDPNFASARAALADAYAFDYANWKKAEREANEAIRLNPNFGEPYATIGFVRLFWEWKLKEAGDEFYQSVQLNPNYATAHQWYAAYFVVTGNFNEALTEIKQSVQLEPNSVSSNADFCQILYFARRYDEALVQCRKTLEINPNFLNTYLSLYEIYCAQEKWNEAINTYFKIQELTNLKLPANDVKKLKETYSKGGIRAFWQTQAEVYLNSRQDIYELAKIYARLGEKEKALSCLKRASDKREFNFIFVLAEPLFSEFRNFQEFSEITKTFILSNN